MATDKPLKPSDLPAYIAQTITAWAAQNGQPSRLVVALSGGLDSQVLLHALSKARSQTVPEQALLALHIDHGLQQQSWGETLAQQCSACGIEFRCIDVSVDTASGKGLEAAARSARYAAFEAFLQEGDLLLLAQHQRDQAETLLLRLLRGAGSRGMAAMPDSRALGRAHLFRPLLAVAQSDLEAYAQVQQLPVLNDPSNQDERFDRNFLRLQVMPLLRQRWPALDTTFATVASLQNDADTLHRALAEIDASRCDLRLEPWGTSICATEFAALSEVRRNNCLRGLCFAQGLTPPSRNLLQSFLAQLNAAGDKLPAVSWQALTLRRWADRLYLQSALPVAPLARRYSLAEAGSGGLGAVTYVVDACADDIYVTVRGASSSKRLKNRFQTLGIPPWMRDFYPLLYQGDTLLAIGEHYLGGQPPLFTLDIEWRAIEQA